MHKLEKLILESFGDIKEDTKKPKDMPKAFLDRIEKQYGPVDMEHDFFNDDLTRYMKHTSYNKNTGSRGHKVIKLASFSKMYDVMQSLVKDIKNLMGSDDIRTDRAARELFDLIKTNFRKLQSYLRTERPDQYAIIRQQAALQEMFKDFQVNASLIVEQREDELRIGKVNNIEIYANDQSSFSDTMFYRLVDTKTGKEFELSVDAAGEAVDLNYVKEENPLLKVMAFPHNDAIGNYIVKDINKELEEGRLLKESMLDEVEDEEEPTPEEAPDTEAPKETVLEDATDKILGKFPTVKAAIIKLQTDQFKEFVDSIDWISPRPSSFRVNLKNGQDYILKWTGKTFEAQILGKRYLLSNIADYQQALDKLAILYKEAPMTGAGEGEAADTDTGGGGGGGGDFPGGDGGAAGEDPAVPDDVGGEEGGEDLTDEPIDFEEPGEEPEA